MKRVVVLGSTGSVGKSALAVIARHPESFRVVGLTAGTNHELLLNQLKAFNPECVALSDPASAAELRKQTGVPVYEGQEGLCRVAAHEGADFVLSAIVGFAGLAPTLCAVRAGKTVGLANKEALVTGGDVVMAEAEKSGATILPVDSEHSAVFQCIHGEDGKAVKKIILTASGGPFFGKSKEQLGAVTPEDALRHPNWSMGKKITIDSATMMNKGLEVIEAYHLFGVGPDDIEVLIHPESIVHSMVEFRDGTVAAQMSVPDMKAPIAYALSYPVRLDNIVPKLDLAGMGRLTFAAPDTDAFPSLLYAYDALRAGGTAPAVLNAANEVAVQAFIAGRIGFNGIPETIRKTMDGYVKCPADTIEAVCEADSWGRRAAAGHMGVAVGRSGGGRR